MLVFKGIDDYFSIVKIIKDALSNSETYEAKRNFPNIRGVFYLVNLENKNIQREVMNVLKRLDKELDTKSAEKDNLISNKLSFFLETGIAFGEHYNLLKQVNENSKAEIILSCPIIWEDKEDATKYLPLFCDDKFISLLQEKYCGDIPEIMLAMREHYDNLLFSTTDSAKVSCFRSSEISKLIVDKEKFVSDVPSYFDIAIEVDSNLRKAGF